MIRNFKLIIALTLLFSFAVSFNVTAQNVTDYLITTDIGSYQASKNPSSGKGAGIIAGADHFYHDHQDMTFRISYFSLEKDTGAKVQVTQHAGSDSDSWLLHEISRDFRNYYGLPGDSFVMRQINGNTIMAAGSGGWTYRWLSSNKVIHIEYTDLQMTKPEPIEVVEAYITKHPSTLTSITSSDLRTNENKTVWIKDEMERRLWLCDKWFAHQEQGKVELTKALNEVVDHLEVFLDYREKYFGVSAENEKKLLSEYLYAKNATAIKNKLTEYKQWWSTNKNNPITLP